MKKVAFFLITATFVIMAALLGWFLPVASFRIIDDVNEGKQHDLDIDRVNLTYRDDLSIAQKIAIVTSRSGYDYMDYVELEKGIYLQEENVIDIMSNFLVDFTGIRYEIDEDDIFYCEPVLLTFASNKGMIVVWSATITLDNGWDFSCYIDDKTGAILSVYFSGYYGGWDSLIEGYNDFSDPCDGICERYLNALYNNYSEKIDAKFITYHLLQSYTDEYYSSYRLIFRDENDDTFDINLNLYVDDMYLETT